LPLTHCRFVHQHDEEFNELKKERRPGRSASTREDLLRIKIAADEKEYAIGFCQSTLPHSKENKLTCLPDLPDLTDETNAVLLDRWEGAWSYLSTLKWVRITSSGLVQEAKFPPKGQS
jgi:translation machinery-associated protein 16